MDRLSFAPINPPDGELRWSWGEEELGHTGWEEVADQTSECWSQAHSCAIERLHDYRGGPHTNMPASSNCCGDLVTNHLSLSISPMSWMGGVARTESRRYPQLAISLATLFPHQIIESNLPGPAKERPPVLGNQYSNLWRRLRAENAPFRILRDDALASAPISFFDPTVMSHVISEAAMVIGNVLVDI